MSHDSHNNNGQQENKPVAFTTPLILGAVTVFIILLFVSLGNPCQGHGEEACCGEEKCSKECMEACEKGDHSKHPAGMSAEACHANMGGHGECGECKDGKVCAHHAEKGCGECDGCKAGKECSHHEQGCGECEGCKAGKECSHHAEGATETAAVTDSTKQEEPVKDEAHH